MAIVVVILVVSAFIMGSYVYVIPPAKIEVSMISEHDESRLPEGTTMILCPNKAGEMGLCNTDERDLHAKYRLVVQPPPPPDVSLRVECKVFEIEPLTPLDNPLFPVMRSWAWENLKTALMDATSNFTCSYTRTGEGTFELDLALIADPYDGQLISRYLLVVTIGYDEPLLPFGLLTRNVNCTDVGDLCLLGYHFGKHPPPGTPESEKALGKFVSCDEAVLLQRELLDIPPAPRPYSYSRVDSGLLTALPTVDGFIGPREWSDAGKLSLSDGRVDAGLYAKNDNDFLYVAVDVTPSQQAPASSRFEVRLFFDVDHDSAWVGGRDVVYVYSSNPSYSGFIRYSEECRPNFLFLDGDYSELAPCLTPLNEAGAMQGRYHEQPAGHWVVEMKIPLRGEGGIMTEPGQVVGMEIGIWGGADSYKDPSFYGRWPAQIIEVTLASGVGTGEGVDRIAQSSSPPPNYPCSSTSLSALTEEQVACLADTAAERVDLGVFPRSVRSLIAVRGHGATVHRGA